MFDERRIRKHGVRARAVVVSMDDHQGMSSQGYRTYDYVLEVRPTGEQPFQVELHHTFGIMESKPQAYDEINVKFDPKSRQVIFDFEGDPRYDLEAMKAHTLEVRRQTAEMNAVIAQRMQQGGVVMQPGTFPAGTFAAGAQPQFVVQHATPGAAGDPVAAIERLAALHAAGALTDDEFQALKSRVLGAD